MAVGHKPSVVLDKSGRPADAAVEAVSVGVSPITDAHAGTTNGSMVPKLGAPTWGTVNSSSEFGSVVPVMAAGTGRSGMLNLGSVSPWVISEKLGAGSRNGGGVHAIRYLMRAGEAIDWNP